jgi:hypothetical protein
MTIYVIRRTDRPIFYAGLNRWTPVPTAAYPFEFQTIAELYATMTLELPLSAYTVLPQKES